jgi:hypothetical protein
MKKSMLVLLVALALAGCKDSRTAQFMAMGKHHIIKQFSGGQQIGEWESTGNISNEDRSDGWYFEDAKTHLLVELTGTVQITVKE